MFDALPRPTLKTEVDAANECDIAAALERWSSAYYLKIGIDDPTREKSRIDGLLHRAYVLAFVEIKTCGYCFGDGSRLWITSQKKVTAACGLHAIVRVPVLIVVRFVCGTLAYVNASTVPYERVEQWGRRDRNSPGDIETGARYKWADFRAIR